MGKARSACPPKISQDNDGHEACASLPTLQEQEVEIMFIQHQLKKYILILFALFFVLSQNTAWCWNRTNHLIIAQIAVDQLNDDEKNKLQTALAKSEYFPETNNYLHAAFFPDEIKNKNRRWNKWHYINSAYSPDGTKTKRAKSPNVVSALKMISRKLKDDDLDPKQKALLLSFLMHLTGDIHQPMHCINRFTKDFRLGDNGGNLFLLPLYQTPNLHALWDDALGLRRNFYSDGRLSFEKIKVIAHQLEQRYPKTSFKKQLKKQSPKSWAKESYEIAKNFAYQTPFNQKPAKNYINEGQDIAAKQLVLAGYRLSDALKEVLD